MQYATKKDIIKIFTERRKAFTDEKEAEDILDALLSFIVKTLKSKKRDTGTYAYKMKALGFFNEYSLDIQNLAKNPDSVDYKKAENMLHEWILSPYRIKLKTEYNLDDDKLRRIG